MNLSALLLALFVILVSISQYFLAWVQFGTTGLVISGIIGLAAGVLMILDGTGSFSYRVGDR
jgi:hypothetical protein